MLAGLASSGLRITIDSAFRLFFDYLINEEGMACEYPVRRISIRLPKPLPRHLKDEEVEKFLAFIKDRGTRPCSSSCSAPASGWKRLRVLP